MLVFCPACSNALTVTSTEEVPPQNRLECRTCPYQFIIDKRYYERRYFPRKEDDDVLGGEGSWDNVDKQDDGMYSEILCHLEELSITVYSTLPQRILQQPRGIFLSGADSQCGRANDYVLQSL